jgi:DNA-binding HxlR family transcriptional regulator
MIHLNDRTYHCNIEVIVDVIGGKWKMLILWHLKDGGTKRFNELRRLIPGVTQKMLTTQLRELERDRIVTRRVYAQVPPRVEYSLSEYGRGFKSFIELSCQMGNAHVQFRRKADKIRVGAPREAALA